MSKKLIIQENIKNKIYTVRDQQVMLDKDLAELYEVETKYLKRQVRRNIEKFPDDFMFELTKKELDNLRCQNGASSWGGSRYLPLAFTEQGVSSLSSVLKNKISNETYIQIIRAFVAMKRFLASNSQIFQRLTQVEYKQIEHDKKIDYVLKQLEIRSDIPKQGIFFNGQIYEAYKFVIKLIKQAEKSLILIDNFIDDSVLTMLDQRKNKVTADIFTKEIDNKLRLSVEKHNEQYMLIRIHETKDFHDRFVIIDNKEIYHIGASLKDLGKKCFAFSKMEFKDLRIVIEKLGK